jgi:hypothetical protein
LFITQFSFFRGVGVGLSRRVCWFIPGLGEGVPHATYLLTCWSVSPKQVWNWHLVAWELSWFLSVMWCGEALCGLEVQGVGVLLILGGFFLQVCGSRVSARFLIYGSHTASSL